MQNNYTADNIKILSDLDHIRHRYGMYIGDNNNPHHLLQEVIDNAIDEIECHGSDKLEVHIDKTANNEIIYTVIDSGAGIPTGYKEVNGKKVSILEAILTKTNSGGKFDNTAYLSSAGTNGVGSTVVNALSDEVYIVSTHNGVTGIIQCIDSCPIEVKYIDTPNKKNGTTFSFRIKEDNKYFDDNEVPFEDIVNKLNVYQAFGIKGIKLVLNSEDVTNKYIIAQTPFDLHKHPMDNGESAIEVDVSVEANNKERFRFAFNYISGASTSYKFNGYVNFLTCPQGGHIMAMQDALVKAFDMFCVKRNIQKPSTMTSDYFIGLNAIGHCNIIEKNFCKPNKRKTYNRYRFNT